MKKQKNEKLADNETKAETKNAFFTPKEERRLKKLFKENNVNLFLSIILGKACETQNYTDERRVETWEKLMNITEKAFEKERTSEAIKSVPDKDKAITISNLLYLTLIVLIPSISLWLSQD